MMNQETPGTAVRLIVCPSCWQLMPAYRLSWGASGCAGHWYVLPVIEYYQLDNCGWWVAVVTNPREKAEGES